MATGTVPVASKVPQYVSEIFCKLPGVICGVHCCTIRLSQASLHHLCYSVTGSMDYTWWCGAWRLHIYHRVSEEHIQGPGENERTTDTSGEGDQCQLLAHLWRQFGVCNAVLPLTQTRGARKMNKRQHDIEKKAGWKVNWSWLYEWGCQQWQ